MHVYRGMLLRDKWNTYYTVVQYESGIVTIENAESGSRSTVHIRNLFTELERV